jgi:hypothetical protein
MAERMVRSVWLALAVATVLGCGAAADPAEQPANGQGGTAREGLDPDVFQITIGRRLRVGERFRFERRQRVDKLKVETLAGKKLGEEQTLTVTSFSGTGEVTSADAQGNELSFAYEIESFARSDEEGEWSLPSGTKLRIVRGLDEAGAVVEIDGRPATPKEREAIAIFVGLTHDDVGDDAIFGTRQARHVGDSWKARDDLIRTKLAGEGVTIPPDGLTATAKLIGVVPTEDGHLREVETSLSIDRFTVPDLPPDVTLADAKLRAKATMVLGPDGRLLENRSNRKSVVEVTVNHPGGDPSRVTISEETTYDSRNKPISN